MNIRKLIVSDVLFLKRGYSMVISMDYEDIYGAKMIKLWNFCFEHCEKVTLTNSYTPRYTVDEYNKAKEKQEVLYDFEEAFAAYTPSSQEDKEQMEFVINNHKLQNIRNYFTGIYSDTELNDFINNIRENYELIERDLTFHNHCTTSTAVMENYTFSLNDSLKQVFFKMDNIFSNVEIIDELIMDDPAFYKDNNVFLSICSHEQYATLNISEVEYEEFRQLNIPHLDTNKMWWHEEYLEKYDKYPSLIYHRGHIFGLDGFQEYIALELGNYEDNEQIFNDFKGKLAPNLLPFEEVLETIHNRYTLIPIRAEELRGRTEQNVLFNTCLVRHLPDSREMRIEIFLVIEDEKSIHLYDKQKEEYDFYKEKMLAYNANYSPNEFIKTPIILGYEYYTNYLWVEGSFKLRDEITLIRGLSEEELRNRQLLVGYVRALRKTNVS